MKIYLILGLALLLGACATSQDVEKPTPEKVVASDVVNGDRPAMWRISDDDSEIFLFGTFHLLPEGVQWESPLMIEAMAKTEHTITEADTQSAEAAAQIQQLVAKEGVNPPGVTLSSVIGADAMAQVKAAADVAGVPVITLEPLRPWLATMVISLSFFTKAEYDPSKGVEHFVLKRAKDENDALSYLETPLEQIVALTSLDDGDAFADFDESMVSLESFKSEMNTKLEAWRSGNVEAMNVEFIEETREASPAVYKALFVERNKKWVAKIRELLAGEGGYFIAVGAGHLVGDESVVKMLKESGVWVQRVQ